MANQEQLKILKQGVDVWNKWREENPKVEIDLSGCNFMVENLQRANFSDAVLGYASLISADLQFADFSEADLSNADLLDANLGGAILKGANLIWADLWSANLSGADLSRANLSNAQVGFGTVFADNDLSDVIGLETVYHETPTSIGFEVIQLSRGIIPAEFLRGCGLSDWEIESTKLYNPNLSDQEIDNILEKVYQLRLEQPLQDSALFISYSHSDGAFVDKLETQLNEKGIRFWRDKHDMKAGRVEKQIDRAIRYNPTVLLILSEQSIKSDWVEHEVRTARELEKELGRDTLCPVALDESWKSSPWPKRVMEQVMEYNILDFSEWENDSKFEGMFRRLIDGLELFYKG